MAEKNFKRRIKSENGSTSSSKSRFGINFAGKFVMGRQNNNNHRACDENVWMMVVPGCVNLVEI